MKTFVIVPAAVAPSRAIRQPRTVSCRIAAKRGPLKRFQHFIETGDWDERYLCNRWIDRLCAAGVAFSFLYFAALLTASLLRH